MLVTSIKQPQSPETCYFSYIPSTSSHFSIETPVCSPGSSTLTLSTLADPSNPLLALRDPPSIPRSPPATMDASKLLQLQTAAAYGSRRPAAQPVQNCTVNSDDSQSQSSSSSSSSSDSSTTSTPQNGFATSLPIRCSRCHRSASLGYSDPTAMVSFGTNLYYCRRCADLVGYLR